MNMNNMQMNMSGRFNQSFPQQPEVLNPLCLTYQNPAWPENQINEHNVLSYFCDPNNTHFYERTSDNEQLRMQANLFQGNPKDLETQLARMSGIQYVLYKSRPPLYVIRKQIRTGPLSVTPLCYYYVLRGVVYQAPDLYSVVNSRIVGAAEPLKTALSNVVDMLQYNPTKGTYSWKFKSEPSKKNDEKNDEKSETTVETESEAWNSRATQYQLKRTEMLLHLLRERFAEVHMNESMAGPSDQMQQ
ncbi:Mediator of RNA polymerase II transcription subunit 6 [Aphelenchoides besseyi]|nr:Mediator of RNA polymerase II transcription subunit 6 [Aphelenchoides besseyi]